jgi:uncharacterized protein
MALTFLIDGYNLIHALGLVHRHIVPHELESARQRLLEFLHERLEPTTAEITVVFDAKRKPRHVPSEYFDGAIRIVFAGRNQEADDVIETLVAEHPQPARLVVVSEDRRLRQAAARRHGRSMGCQELLDYLEKGPAPAPAASPPNPDARRLSQSEVQDWLKEFDDVKMPDEFRDFLDPPPANE